jgi:hypothetical protein
MAGKSIFEFLRKARRVSQAVIYQLPHFNRDFLYKRHDLSAFYRFFLDHFTHGVV